MLSELKIQNFAVIEDIYLKLGPGLTIISGDEGAGKSLIVDAISMLLGCRATSNLIRTGATSARIEGIFWLTEREHNLINKHLFANDIDIDKDGLLIIRRDIQPLGRSLSRINGHAVPQSLLRLLGQNLVDIHGQMEYMSLFNSSHQLAMVDDHGELSHLRIELAKKLVALRQKRKEMISCSDAITTGHVDLLKHQIQEIVDANLKHDEDKELQEKRDLLRNSEVLKSGSQNAYRTLYGDDRSATVLLHESINYLQSLSHVTNALSPQKEYLDNVLSSLEDLAREIKAFGENVESDVALLEEIEERLTLINKLKYKYGKTIGEINAFLGNAQKELESIENRSESIIRLRNDIAHMEELVGKKAEELSLLRRKASESLAKLVNEELFQIGLKLCNFGITLNRHSNQDGIPVSGGVRYGFTDDGIDNIEFMISTNPGEPLRPLAKIASGGETCRIMLAIKSALNRIDPLPTLIFDEIDANVGGRSGDSMGKKLADLGQQHQVLCITHLPQIACFADNHIKITKNVNSGRSSTKFEEVIGRNRVIEIAAMLGSEQAGQPMIDGASKLITKAQTWKEQSITTDRTLHLN